MYISLQILRGMAAWAIVFSHIIQSYYRIGPDEGNQVISMASTFAFLGVDIFFVLSGFVMALTASKYSGQGALYAVNRILRVMPAYWFYMALLLVSFILLPAETYMTDYTLETLLKSFFLIPHENPKGIGNYPFLYVGWTLTYEMFFYFVLSAVLMFYFKVPALVCSFALFVLAFATMNLDWLGHSSFLLIEFISGMWIYLYIQHKFSWKIHTIVAGLLLFIIAVILFNYRGVPVVTGLFVSAFVVFMAVWCEPICKKLQCYLSFFQKLGDYSYSTYLSHLIVIGWFYAIFNTVALTFAGHIAVIMGICIVTLAVSYLSYQMLENGKWVQHLRHLVKIKSNSRRLSPEVVKN